MIGWARPRQIIRIVNWCGHAQNVVAWPGGNGYWMLVPVVEVSEVVSLPLTPPHP